MCTFSPLVWLCQSSAMRLHWRLTSLACPAIPTWPTLSWKGGGVSNRRFFFKKNLFDSDIPIYLPIYNKYFMEIHHLSVFIFIFCFLVLLPGVGARRRYHSFSLSCEWGAGVCGYYWYSKYSSMQTISSITPQLFHDWP